MTYYVYKYWAHGQDYGFKQSGGYESGSEKLVSSHDTTLAGALQCVSAQEEDKSGVYVCYRIVKGKPKRTSGGIEVNCVWAGQPDDASDELKQRKVEALAK